MKKTLTAAVTVLGFVGLMAAAPANAATDFNLSNLLTATQADLVAAKADADAHGDTIASQCYGGVSNYITANGGITFPAAPVGVASTFQIARDGVKAVQQANGQGIPKELVVACGPLALDVQNDLGRAAAGFTLLGVKLW